MVLIIAIPRVYRLPVHVSHQSAECLPGHLRIRTEDKIAISIKWALRIGNIICIELNIKIELFSEKMSSVTFEHNTQMRRYELSTNLAELPNDLHWRLASSLNFQTVWMKIISDSTSGPFSLNVSEYDRILRAKNQGSSLLYLWGNRGQTIQHLLLRLQSFSKMHGTSMDGPQLALRRKFVPVKWSSEEQVTVSMIGIDDCMLQFVCHARGFPWPRFQWTENDKDIDCSNGKTLVISRCGCRSGLMYRCKIWNEVEEGFEYSTFYRKAGKLFQSKLITDPVDLSLFVTVGMRVNSCGRCAKYKNLTLSVDYCRAIQNGYDIGGWNAELIATDKVALIISNCNYINLPSLVTPHCDAEMFAESLQNLGFKTVALGDLNLAEMHFFIKEYRKLLGDGVYAVFYFVGHGFERNGKNYLLAIDAPDANCKMANCISVEWVLSVFEDSHPALNLILLDVCRKNVKCIDTSGCFDDVDNEKMAKIARNTVCGYATSSGVSAFEVSGEKNGVFMKHLLQHIADEVTVLDMLTKTFQEISNDTRICDVQIPELKSNLILPRGLRDPLVCRGHTSSFTCHTLYWRYMHELPIPINIRFTDQNMFVIIWYDYVGHFTNKVYIFSSVGDLSDKNNTSNLKSLSTKFSYIAHLRFPEHVDVSAERIIEDGDEGVSTSIMLSNLQRLKGNILCSIDIANRKDNVVIASKSNLSLGDILVTRIYRMNYL
ncbi:Mucosa-associated lymphoid tissue lymphoma translocation protein [Dirofilaria immitis]